MQPTKQIFNAAQTRRITVTNRGFGVIAVSTYEKRAVRGELKNFRWFQLYKEFNTQSEAEVTAAVEFLKGKFF